MSASNWLGLSSNKPHTASSLSAWRASAAGGIVIAGLKCAAGLLQQSLGLLLGGGIGPGQGGAGRCGAAWASSRAANWGAGFASGTPLASGAALNWGAALSVGPNGLPRVGGIGRPWSRATNWAGDSALGLSGICVACTKAFAELANAGPQRGFPAAPFRRLCACNRSRGPFAPRQPAHRPSKAARRNPAVLRRSIPARLEPILLGWFVGNRPTKPKPRPRSHTRIVRLSCPTVGSSYRP